MSYKIASKQQELLIFDRLNSSGTPFNLNDQFLYGIKSIIDEKQTLEKIEKYSSVIFLEYKFMVIILAILYGSKFKYASGKFIDESGKQIDVDDSDWKLSNSRPRIHSKKILQEFKNYKYGYLKDTLEKTDNEIEKQINDIKIFLLYHEEENKDGFPRIMMQKIFNSCPEILLELMRKWEFFKGVENKKDVLCFIVKIYVFGMNKTTKSHAYYNIANKIRTFSPSSNEKTLDNLYLHLERERFSNGEILYDISDKFIEGNKLKYIENDISLIYAQRNYIESLFPKEDIYILLEDVNKPFDSDHIFPHKFCSNKNSIFKNYDLTNENRRMLDLSENRSTHDENPIFQLPIKE
jgi:hypothetical protein